MNIPAFIEATSDADPSRRRDAAIALGALAKDGAGDEHMLRALVALLDDADGGARQAATTALGWLSYKRALIDPNALDALLRLLDDEIGMVRHDAAWILEAFVKKGIVDQRALPMLARNCEHTDADVRAASLFCLSLYAERIALPPDIALAIERHKDDPDKTCRRAAAAGLSAIASK